MGGLELGTHMSRRLQAGRLAAALCFRSPKSKTWGLWSVARLLAVESYSMGRKPYTP